MFILSPTSQILIFPCILFSQKSEKRGNAAEELCTVIIYCQLCKLLSLDIPSVSVPNAADTAVEEEMSESSNSQESDGHDSDEDVVEVVQQEEHDSDGLLNNNIKMKMVTEEERRESSPDDSETDTADEDVPDRRYPQRERRPPDRYQTMTPPKRLDIVHDLLQFLNKD